MESSSYEFYSLLTNWILVGCGGITIVVVILIYNLQRKDSINTAKYSVMMQLKPRLETSFDFFRQGNFFIQNFVFEENDAMDIFLSDIQTDESKFTIREFKNDMIFKNTAFEIIYNLIVTNVEFGTSNNKYKYIINYSDIEGNKYKSFIHGVGRYIRILKTIRIKK